MRTALGSGPRRFTLALLLILAVAGPSWVFIKPLPLNESDQPFYIGIAYDIRHVDRFTNGFVWADDAPGAPRSPGMRFAPLYPWLLAEAAGLDRSFAEGMDCVVETAGKSAACPDRAPLMRAVQFGMLAAFFMLIWRMTGFVSASRVAPWLALGLALATAPMLLHYVDAMMTEMTALFLFTAASAAAARGVREARPAPWFFAAGLWLGLTALTRPAFFYLCILCGAVGLAVALWTGGRRPRLTAAALFNLGILLPVGPWILRNAVVFGHAALTRGYDSHTLVQRISFNQMTWPEYALSYLCWLPDGKGLGHWLFGPQSCDRFQWDERPDTFYAIGTGPLMRATLEAAGGWEHHLGYLVWTYILPHPITHALVTIPLALRGAWIDHYWGFCLLPVLLVMLAKSLRTGNWPFIVIAVPALVMLVFNAAVAVNQVRYNLILIPAFSVAGAMALDGVLTRHRAIRNGRAAATRIAAPPIVDLTRRIPP